MKKIIVLLFLAVGFTFTSNAQLIQPKLVTTTSYGNTLDTVTNAGNKVTTAYKVTPFKNGVTAQVTVTKISGTVGGSIVFQGSMDGTNFTTIGSATTPSDASATYAFNTTAAYYYYRVSYTGTGTMSASMRTYIYAY
jgi:hypothetical protein